MNVEDNLANYERDAPEGFELKITENRTLRKLKRTPIHSRDRMACGFRGFSSCPETPEYAIYANSHRNLTSS